MTIAGRVLLEPPLDPSPDEARSWLRGELLDPDYHQQNLVQRILTWLGRQVDRGLAAAGDTPPLTTFATMLVFLLLVVALVWLLSRARRTARSRDSSAVLTDERVTAARLRARADAALGAGRHEDAVVEGFRALAVRQVEQGRLDDAPGATAREVAAALGAAYPSRREQVDGSALVFDLVLYGDRAASRDQAVGVLALDDELAVQR